ncbi:family 20 glycosylhydrolase [Enterococcus sp. AZ192]|uniref:family 20 glycosylhydrolase n=1 Tax=unclassified Enterococcus TaxID=2608891 RepID=UPI003D26DCE5
MDSELSIFLDAAFCLSRKQISELYERLLGKKVRFVSDSEEAKVVMKRSSGSSALFSIESVAPLLLSADNENGAFQGLMYVARSLRLGKECECGSKIPKISERIIMLDIGRKYFTPNFLRRLLEEMALFGFNYLQLHFSEDTGLGIESKKYPELNSKKTLSQKEVHKLIEDAAELSIEIIPDLDTPGHMTHILKEHPEWQLKELTSRGISSVSSAMDVTNEAAVAFTFSLYQEYMALFTGCRYFHIGADEFADFDHFECYPALADRGQEKFEGYVNSVAALVRQAGFIPRVWNDAFFRKNRTSTLSEELEITYWTRWQKEMAPVQTFLDKDYSVINFNDNYLYYVLGENAGYSYPTAQKIKEKWQPDLFASEQKVKTEHQEQIKGAALAIWCDKPEAKEEETIFLEVVQLMAAFSEHFYQ